MRFINFIYICVHCQTNALTHNVKSCKQINEGKKNAKHVHDCNMEVIATYVLSLAIMVFIE